MNKKIKMKIILFFLSVYLLICVIFNGENGAKNKLSKMPDIDSVKLNSFSKYIMNNELAFVVLAIAVIIHFFF